jgi:flagellar basal-body rod modification protein FlgD
MSTTVDGVSSSVGIDGNSYTTSVSNDELTSEDFLTLMLTELSMQDPTEPMDSSSMLDSQLQLSTLDANISMTESMETLAASFSQTTLANSANIIGHIVEDGSTNEEGISSQYKVTSVASEEGEIYLKGYEILGYDDMYYFEPVDDSSVIANGNDEGDSITFTDSSGTEHTFSTVGKSYEELAEEIAAVDGLGADVVETTDNQQQLIIAVNNANSSLTQNGLSLDYSTNQNIIYSNELSLLNYNDLTNIY